VYVNGELWPEHLIVARNTNDKGPLKLSKTLSAKERAIYVFIFPKKLTPRVWVTTLRRPGFSFRGERETGKGAAELFIFVMGDDPNNSLDSRAWGFVPARTGHRARDVVYWSLRRNQAVQQPA